MNEENMTKIMEFNKEEQTIEILGHKIDKSYESWESFLEEMKRLTLLQNNWNELKKWLESKGTSVKDENDALCYFYIYKKMQELEGNNE